MPAPAGIPSVLLRYLRKNGIPACAAMTALLFASIANAGPSEPPSEQMRAALIAAIDRAESFQHKFDAEVWLLDMSTRLKKYVPDEQRRLELLRVVHSEAARAQLSPELVLAVVDVESRFDHYAVSHAGALGLMQIMPFWLDEIGKPGDNLFNMQTNLRFGCAILKYYLELEQGRLAAALQRYNGSLGNPAYSNLVLKALHGRWYRS
jgi:soluble lytic murein transglycosylase-like protein